MHSNFIKQLILVLLVALIVFSTASIVLGQKTRPQAQEAKLRYETKSITINGKTITRKFVIRPTGMMANQEVTNNNDSGAGSFRQALLDVGDGEEITFNISGSDVITVLNGGVWPSTAFLVFGKDITINGTNIATGNNVTVQVTTPGTSAYRLFYIGNGTQTFQNITLKGGAPFEDDGGVFHTGAGNLVLTNTTISDGAARNGGGIYSSGIVIIDKSTISGNSTTSTPGNGGGIYIGSGTLSITNSTISGNTAIGKGGAINTDNSSNTIESSTIANNHSDNDDSGGEQGGGFYIKFAGASLTAKNTIIANNFSGSGTGTGDDYYYESGALTDNGYNVVEYQAGTSTGAGKTFNATTDILYNTKADGTTGYSTWNRNSVDLGNQNLNLATTLTNNGTTKTETLNISAGSFAYGAGPNPSPVATDQIGTARMSPPTIGAYEYIPVPAVVITESNGSTDVTEGGASPQDSYTVVLTTAPTATVTVTVTPDAQLDVGSGGGTALTPPLSFDNTNWSTPQTVNVDAVDDAAVEGAHTGTITNAATSGDGDYDGIPINNVTANITDNDSDPDLAIAATDANKAEGNAGNTAFTFTVTRSGNTAGTSSANYAVTGSGGNPANAADFGGTFPSGSVSFASSETTKPITINVSGDTDFEPDEGFTVTLSNPVNANITTATANGTIQNDDAAPAPEMDVSGLGISIANNDGFPSTTDDTEYGNVDLTGGSVEHEFTITNTGTAALNLAASPPRVVVTGADFTRTQDATTPVALGGGTTKFKITFNPSVVGLRQATVSISNDDGDENPYQFLIQGTGIAPEMDVTGNGVSIPDINPVPIVGNDTDYGSVQVGTPHAHTFTVHNSGTAVLNLASGTPRVVIGGTHTSDFVLTVDADATVAANNGTSEFTITFTPGATGLRQVDISISNDDLDENPYNFRLQGTGTTVAPPTVTTAAVTGVTTTTANSGGNVTADGGTAVTTRGVCWSTSANPTVADNTTSDGTGTGAFTSSITGLSSETKYYVRAYATNGAGTSYGNERSFTTLIVDTDGDSIPDSKETGDRDGDGIADKDDYDPTGWIYLETNGLIITGGTIGITGPGSVNIIEDGSTGYYQWTVTTPGTYTMTYTPPTGYLFSATCLPQTAIYDPTPTPDPNVVGDGSRNGTTDYMTDWECSNNPFYLIFNLADGDPLVINNNIPLQQQPTGVTLSSFDAVVNSDGVVISWTTETEPDIAGFNIHRCEQENGEYIKINPSMIPTQGNSTTGASYSYTDTPEEGGTYYYKLEDINLQGESTFNDPVFVNVTSVDIKQYIVPAEYTLSQNYPNPFNPETSIEYGMPKAEVVSINIYDINGHLVRNLVAERKAAGNHSATWNARDNNGIRVVSGMYFYILKAGDYSQTLKMILMK